MAGARTLGETYRRAGGGSPLHEQVLTAVGGSDAALQALAAAPLLARRPAQVLAALHDLALAGRAPALATAYAAGDGEAAARAAVEALLSRTGEVVALAARRPVRTVDVQRCAVLHPAVAEAAHRAGADAVGLVGVDCSAGLDVLVDQVAVSYDRGPLLGDPSSAVQVSALLRGPRPVPSRPVPEVVTRTVVEAEPVDVTDADDVRWLRACLPPDHPDDRAALDAAVALAASAPPRLVRGEVVDALPEALARVPDGALPVVTTCWALSRLPLERRLGFLQVLSASGRAVAWVSVEGVGVAPQVPTLGDRPASGHSLVGVALLGRGSRQVETVGRCWSRGSRLEWLAEA